MLSWISGYLDVGIDVGRVAGPLTIQPLPVCPTGADRQGFWFAAERTCCINYLTFNFYRQQTHIIL